jgi:hypothetical protein
VRVRPAAIQQVRTLAPRRRWALAAAGVVAVLVLAAVVWVVPRLLYPPLPASRFVGVAPDRRIELETNRLKLQGDARATLAQILAGGILLVGAYLTWRQLAVNREGQITERYTRAIDQLGHSQLDVRLGGIYALERIARDSPADRSTIGEVLTAFVRGHAPWPPRLDDQPATSAPINEVPELQVRAPDVQASLTVLGRGSFARREGRGDRLDLSGVDLRRANLGGAHLVGALLRAANLEWAFLGGAHLEEAYLGGANLEEADLEGARLEEALLGGANLEGADLTDAHLEEASLGGANLERAGLGGAHLERASLGGAHLKGAFLDGARLEGAFANASTAWPAGFDWRAAGVIMAGEDTAERPPQQE